MSTGKSITEPILLDSTGKSIVAALESVASRLQGNNTTPKNTVVYAGNMYGPPSTGGYISSVDTFNFDNCYIINMVVKNLLQGNLYQAGDLFTLRQDESNYFTLTTDSYNLTLKNVKGGATVNSVKLTSSSADTMWSTLSNAGSYAILFDYIHKKFNVYTLSTLSNSIMEKTISIDLNDWDLSHIEEFNICSEYSNRYVGFTALKYIVLNNYLNYSEILSRKLDANNFAASFPTSYYGTGCAKDFVLNLGGTITETIDDRHKVATYNNASAAYFAIGTNSSKYRNNLRMTSLTKVKFSNITAETTLSRGAGGEILQIYDEDLNLLAESKSLVEPISITVEADKWYILSVFGSQSKTHSVQYLSGYAWYLKGAGTVEAIALGVGYELNGVCSSLNYNGAYFTGSLPFLGTNIRFSQSNPALYTQSLIPTYSLKVENGVIYMFNGSEWKQITS